jgi:acetyltransferase-like isoleucine patch superfamily enzyme
MMLGELFLKFIDDLLRPWSGPVGVMLRRVYYRRRLKHCGSHLTIGPGVYLDGPEHMSFGDYVHLDKNVIITAGPLALDARSRSIPNPDCCAPAGEVVIGDRCHIAAGCVLQGHGGVSIGRSFTASANALIYSLSNSPYENRDGQVATDNHSVARVVTPVAIGNNVWLGLQSVVVGNTIGDDCFVKPLSLVISNIPPNMIAAGNPAKAERSRFPD